MYISSKAYRAGKRDYFNGVKYEDCPVKNGPDVQMISWWQSGWMDAKEEDDMEKKNDR